MARTRKPIQSQHDEFVFRVSRPSTTYFFSLQYQRWSDDPYSEMLSLTFQAECLCPDRIKGRQAEAHFSANAELAAESKHRERRPEKPIQAIGSVVFGKDRFEVSGFLPPDTIWRLGTAMANGTMTSMTAGGVWIKRSHAHLRSFGFRGPDFDPVAYIG